MPDIKQQVQAAVPLPDNNPEGQMAKADLYRAAKMSIKLFQMIQDGQNLEEWVQSKIIKSADYLDSIYHYMEYQMKFGNGATGVASVDDITAELDTLTPPTEERAEEDDEELTNMDESMNYEQKLKALLEGAMIKKGIKEAKKSKPDFLDVDKDGNKKEPMKKAIKDKKVKEGRNEDGDEYGWDVKEKKTKAPASRKVAGKAYGGAAQKDDSDEETSVKKTKKVKEATDEKRAPAKKTTRTVDLPSGKKGTVTKVQGWQSQKAEKAADKEKDLDEAKKSKPDFLDVDKDGNKKEPMKKAAKEKTAVKESAELTAILKLAGRRPLNG